MGKEQPPDSSKVIDLEQRRREKEKKRREAAEPERPELPKDLLGESFNRRKYIESEINAVGKDKWRKLEKFAKIEVLKPGESDRELAEDFKNISDEDLLIHFRITDEDIWKGEPFAFKTLYEELERRRKGE